jgi:hypothetical protein
VEVGVTEGEEVEDAGGLDVEVCAGVEEVVGGLDVVAVGVVVDLPQLMRAMLKTKISVRARNMIFFTVLSFLPLYIIRLPI